jgi:predicted GIY-YIG superfamily endonuclease
MNDVRRSSVYAIVHRDTGRIYFGYTTNVHRRWREHKKARSGCVLLRSALAKYAPDAFDWVVVASNLTREEGLVFEEALISAYETNDKALGFNLWSGGAAPEPSPETKDKIRAARLGQRHRPDSLAKMRAEKGSEASREASRARSLGRRHSTETRRLISEVQRGKKRSPATRARMSQAQKGRTFTDETVLKMTLAKNRHPVEVMVQCVHLVVEKGLTRREVSQRAGVPVGIVTRWVAGQGGWAILKPFFPELRRYASAAVA